MKRLLTTVCISALLIGRAAAGGPGVPGDPMTVRPAGVLNATPLVALYGDHPSVRMFGSANASGHWNGDGVNDDAPAINATIAYYCSLPYGGNIDIPNGTAAIASTISIPCSNVHNKGQGTGAPFHDIGTGALDFGTSLKWIGPAGGTMVSIQPPAGTATASTTRKSNDDFTGILLEGNGVAGTGLDMRSVSGSSIKVAYHNLTAYGVRVDTTPLAEFDDPQGNDFWIEGSNEATSGVGVLCDGTATTGANNGNCSLNHFRHVFLRIKNGDGFVFGYSDHNFLDYLNVQVASGGVGGRGLVFRAGAQIGSTGNGYVSYNNVVRYVTGPAPIVAQGTESAAYPSHDNIILDLDRSNATPFPSGGTGATYRVVTDNGNIFSQNEGLGINTDSPSATLDVNGNVDSVQGFQLNHQTIIDGANNAGFATVTAARGVSSGGPVMLAPYTVAGINGAFPCNASNAGKIVYVRDATSSTHYAVLSGNGNIGVSALCNGSDWVGD